MSYRKLIEGWEDSVILDLCRAGNTGDGKPMVRMTLINTAGRGTISQGEFVLDDLLDHLRYIKENVSKP